MTNPITPETFRVDPKILDPEVVAGATTIGRHLLEAPGAVDKVRFVADHLREQFRVEVERVVYSERVPTAPELVPFEVTVPYDVTVSVDLPRSWWRRLLRRPAPVVTRRARGRVVARGHALTEVAAKVRFPDLDRRHYPATFGAPIMWVDPPTIDEVWLRQTETFPEDGPHGAVSREGEQR
jgi:hypothetical protein